MHISTDFVKIVLSKCSSRFWEVPKTSFLDANWIQHARRKVANSVTKSWVSPLILYRTVCSYGCCKKRDNVGGREAGGGVEQSAATTGRQLGPCQCSASDDRLLGTLELIVSSQYIDYLFRSLILLFHMLKNQPNRISLFSNKNNNFRICIYIDNGVRKFQLRFVPIPLIQTLFWKANGKGYKIAGLLPPEPTRNQP